MSRAARIESPRRKICFLASSSTTSRTFLTPHLKALSQDYAVTLITNLIQDEELRTEIPEVEIVDVRISRKISLIADISALLLILRCIRSTDFDAVISVTPKAGLLSALAARMAGVPVRIHWFTGQVWATKRGPFRRFLRAVDRLIVHLSTLVLADGRSQAEFIAMEGVLGLRKCEVLLDGSISGVDLTRFKPLVSEGSETRKQLGIPFDSTVALFVGRLALDKGVVDLAKALAQITPETGLHSIWVGSDEERYVRRLKTILDKANHACHFVGYSPSPEVFIAAADFIVLPSYREGFGTSVIEAGAMGVPSIVSDVYGLKDAVVKNETALVFEAGNIEELRDAILTMVANTNLRRDLGKNSRSRVKARFSQKKVVSEFARLVTKQIDETTSRKP